MLAAQNILERIEAHDDKSALELAKIHAFLAMAQAINKLSIKQR